MYLGLFYMNLTSQDDILFSFHFYLVNICLAIYCMPDSVLSTVYTAVKTTKSLSTWDFIYYSSLASNPYIPLNDNSIGAEEVQIRNLRILV